VWPARQGMLAPLWLAIATTGALATVAVWESLAIRHGVVPEAILTQE
jgi:hypothetical protein